MNNKNNQIDNMENIENNNNNKMDSLTDAINKVIDHVKVIMKRRKHLKFKRNALGCPEIVVALQEGTFADFNKHFMHPSRVFAPLNIINFIVTRLVEKGYFAWRTEIQGKALYFITAVDETPSVFSKVKKIEK